MDNIFKKFVRLGGDDPMNYEYNILARRWSYVKAVLLDEETILPFEIEIQPSSACNLTCYWCIGKNIQTMNQVTRLPNNITPNNILNITRSLAEYRKGDIRIDTVKFSGFIGEPLVNKKATLMAINDLINHNIRVGLFTNGILLADPEVQETVANIDYIHISLDAGTPETFAFTKSKANYDKGKENFDLILKNLRSLAETKSNNNAALKINIGFIVNSHNYKEIFGISKRVKEEGADLIRFKRDIAATQSLDGRQINLISEQIERAKREIEDKNFRVVQIHSKKEIQMHSPFDFSKCYVHFLWGTIGSDGNVYPCDHTTFPGAPYYGNAINRPFKDIWEGPLRKQIINGVPAVCHKICSPFALRINYFLNQIKQIIDDKGIEFAEQQRTEFLNN